MNDDSAEVEAAASSPYDVHCWAGRYLSQWVVLRKRDGKVMTEGTLSHCLHWVRFPVDKS